MRTAAAVQKVQRSPIFPSFGDYLMSSTVPRLGRGNAAQTELGDYMRCLYGRLNKWETVVLPMVSSYARDGLIDLLEDLEFFLEIAEESIEERDQIIQELVASLEAMAEAVNGDRNSAETYACRALIAKARALVPC